MATRKPLVLDLGQMEQLQRGDDLDVPTLQDQIDTLNIDFRKLLSYLINLGFEIPTGLEEQFIQAIKEQ